VTFGQETGDVTSRMPSLNSATGDGLPEGSAEAVELLGEDPAAERGALAGTPGQRPETSFSTRVAKPS
jgi:hypothetical protein